MKSNSVAGYTKKLTSIAPKASKPVVDVEKKTSKDLRQKSKLEKLDEDRIPKMNKDEARKAKLYDNGLRNKLSEMRSYSEILYVMKELLAHTLKSYTSEYIVKPEEHLIIRGMNPRELSSWGASQKLKSASVYFPNIQMLPYNPAGSRGCICAMGANNEDKYGKFWVHDGETCQGDRLTPIVYSERNYEDLPDSMKQDYAGKADKKVSMLKLRTKDEMKDSLEYGARYYRESDQSDPYFYNEILIKPDAGDEKCFSPFISWSTNPKEVRGLFEESVRDFDKLFRELSQINPSCVPCLICEGRIYAVKKANVDNDIEPFGEVLKNLTLISKAQVRLNEISRKERLTLQTQTTTLRM